MNILPSKTPSYNVLIKFNGTNIILEVLTPQI